MKIPKGVKIAKFKLCSYILLLVTTTNVFGQLVDQYSEIISSADSSFQKKEYLKAAQTFSKAFLVNKDRGRIEHRYTAARSWALAGNIDSALYHLTRNSKSGYYTDFEALVNQPDFEILHADPRWKEVLSTVSSNKEKKDRTELNFDKTLVVALDSIHKSDQLYRSQIIKDDSSSPEFKYLQKMLLETDSINIAKVSAILDRYGWLGTDVIGDRGSTTLFLVIQHASLPTQEKYLPLLRKAVQNNKASPINLAYLEDRIATRKGGKQLYGTQIGCDKNGKNCWIQPIEDEKNINIRRLALGLESLEDYAMKWNINYKVPEN